MVIDLTDNNSIISMNTTETNYTETLITLYHLTRIADGEISESEYKLGEYMKIAENIDEQCYDNIMRKMSVLSKNHVYDISIQKLKACSYDQQVRCIAWMRMIANSDGYMAKEEWSLIFRIYKTELNLSLKDIIAYPLPQAS